MARLVTPSQYRSMFRQAQNKQNQAIRKYEQEVNRTINKHNQEVKREINKLNQGIRKYNLKARAHNAKVRQNRQRIQSALSRLRSTPVTATYSVLRTTSYSLNEAHETLERHAAYEETDPRHRLMVDLPEQENANNLALTNALLNNEIEDDEEALGSLESTTITDELEKISSDLHKRWLGALFALNPQNPDAPRHFCTSAREIFTQIIHINAPDNDVLSLVPDCQKTEEGKPTRRARIRFLLQRNGMASDSFEDFIEKNIESFVELFKIFNEGAHGPAGQMNRSKLLSLKTRVEDAIIFLTSVATSIE